MGPEKDTNISDRDAERELTFGEKAVGLSFNPSKNEAVDQLKRQAAQFIEACNDFRNATEDGEVKRMLSVAITEAQTAQMWAVKAVTWNLKK
jgi:hypothetical protein